MHSLCKAPVKGHARVAMPLFQVLCQASSFRHGRVDLIQASILPDQAVYRFMLGVLTLWLVSSMHEV